jgi:iron complex transport system substrate-binding protein
MSRVVSLLPAATEIVGALGLMNRLLAVSHECDHPEEANRRPRITHCEIHNQGLDSQAIDRWVAERLASHGTLYTLDEPKLRDLAPDLLLTQRLCDVCAPSYGSVEALARTLPSAPRVLNLEPNSLEDVLGCIQAVAEAMGHPARGEEVCGRLRQRVADVEARVRGLPRPTVFLMEWAQPIFNAGHWSPELVRRAGGTPVLAAEGVDSVRVPWGELRAADPDVVIIACCGHTVERTHQDVPLLEALPGWHELRAVRERRVYLANGAAYFSRPGPRVVDSLEIVAALLHPEACQGTYPDRGVVRL